MSRNRVTRKNLSKCHSCQTPLNACGLIALGIREYRQVFFKPYRIIYRALEKRVVVMLIADGRRDMVAVLAERLL